MSQLGKQFSDSSQMSTRLSKLSGVPLSRIRLGEWRKTLVWACERGKMPKEMIFRKNLSHKIENNVSWSSGDRGWPNTYALRTPGASVLAPWKLSLGSGERTLQYPWRAWAEEAVSDISITVGHKGDWSRKWKTRQGPRTCGMPWVHVKC